MADTIYNLGRVGLNLRGEYDPATAYAPLDVVSWRGGSYAAKAATADVSPPRCGQMKWEMLVQDPVARNTGEQAAASCWIDGKMVCARTILYSTPATGNASIEHRFGFNGMDAVWVDVPATFLIYKDGTGVADLRVEGEIASW